MRVGQARAAAAQWVMRHARDNAEFRGAFYSGSTVSMSDDDVLPPASDIDVVVVTARDEPPLKLGKFRYLGALLEVTHLPWDRFASTDDILRRAGDVIRFLPRLRETTEAILATNPGTEPEGRAGHGSTR